LSINHGSTVEIDSLSFICKMIHFYLSKSWSYRTELSSLVR